MATIVNRSDGVVRLAYVHSMFSCCPSIRRHGTKLIAQTNGYVWLFSLGLFNRIVTFDADKRVLVIIDRYAWLFRVRRRFRFDHIRAIAYGYSDWNSFGGFSSARDSLDVFEVGIKIFDDTNPYRRLFTFFGDGAFVNDSIWPDWMYWEEYAFDVAGVQESESRQFVEVLSKLTGAPIEPK